MDTDSSKRTTSFDTCCPVEIRIGMGDRCIKLWPVVNKNILAIAIDRREGAFWELWTRVCAPEV
jgi:hypothetical protein